MVVRPAMYVFSLGRKLEWLQATLTPIQIRIYNDKIIIANDCIFPEDWTVDDLMGSHKSRPYNPLIATTFFRSGFIEAWRRGIQKIKDSCIMAGNDIPEYSVKKEDIMVTFRGLHRATPQTTPQLDEIDSRIIKVIESNPSVSQRKIAVLIGVSYDTVRYHMENMRKQEIIARKGNGLFCKPLAITEFLGTQFFSGRLKQNR